MQHIAISSVAWLERLVRWRSFFLLSFSAGNAVNTNLANALWVLLKIHDIEDFLTLLALRMTDDFVHIL